METYFHQMLMTLGGWAQYARYKLWQAELAGGSDDTITDLLTIRLLWEEALFERYGEQISGKWDAVRAAHAAPVAPTADEIVKSILQEAAERAAQRRLAETLAASPPRSHRKPPGAPGCVLYRCAVRGLSPRA